MRFLYDIFFLIFSFFYLPLFLIKGKHKEGFSERFGAVPIAVKEGLSDKEVIWIHAVSVGEMLQAVRLADALRKRVTNSRFVLTATTATGLEIAKKFKKNEDFALCFPLDFRASVRAFVGSISPKAVIILETEIWPNLLKELSDHKIPFFILNGRISDRAFPKYQLVKFFLKPILNSFKYINTQDDLMRRRFIALGAATEKVFVTGNMKYDWAPPSVNDEEVEKIRNNFKTEGTILCIAGSTHEGEEEILFDVYKSLKAKHHAFKLMIAPRHLNRTESIHAQAFRRDISLRNVSALLRSSARAVLKEGEVLLLDKMGLLANLYRIADFVFVGGSLVPYGGHNLIEPAFFEKPVVFGNFMQNFKEMAEMFKKSGAAEEVRSQEELKNIFSRLIEDISYRQKLGIAAKKMIALNSGATERNIQTVMQNLNR